MDLSGRMRFFLSCPQYLEELLAQEVKELIDAEGELKRGGISLAITLQQAFTLLLESRLASRLFWQIGKSRIRNEEDLKMAAGQIRWKSFLHQDQTFKFTTLLDPDAKTVFPNSIFLSQLCKDSLVYQFQKEVDSRPSVSLDRPDQSFLVRIESDERRRNLDAFFFVDMTNKPLSDRGYRAQGHFAPIRENLAAALIKLTEWDKESLFIDTMCGSGTIAIEAALMKLDIPPSYLKILAYIEEGTCEWPILTMPILEKFLPDFEKVTADAKKKILAALNKPATGMIIANDFSQKAIQITKESIKLSMLKPDLFAFSTKDATKMQPPKDSTNGVVICNPPYGERLDALKQNDENIKKLYFDYTENLKQNFKGFRAYILTGDLEMRKGISLRTSKKIPLKNGNIECRLLEYKLY